MEAVVKFVNKRDMFPTRQLSSHWRRVPKQRQPKRYRSHVQRSYWRSRLPIQKETISEKVTSLLDIHLTHECFRYSAGRQSSNLLCPASMPLTICLVLGRATASHSQYCLIFFIQLNYVHKSKQNKLLPPYVKLPCTRWHQGFHFLFLYQFSHFA